MFPNTFEIGYNITFCFKSKFQPTTSKPINVKITKQIVKNKLHNHNFKD